MTELMQAYSPMIGVMALVAIALEIIKAYIDLPKQFYPAVIIALALGFTWLMAAVGFASIELEEAFVLALMASGAYGWGKAMLGKS